MGYTTGLVFIHHTTGMTPPGVAEQYRGGDSTAVSDAAMKFPKPYAEMLNITHTHLLSMAAIFIVSGLALALVRAARAALAADPGRRAVRRPAGLVFVDVAHALRRRPRSAGCWRSRAG